MTIAVLDYGIGNLGSAQKALVRVGADARLVTKPADAEGATGVVLPGVGAFGACMKALRDCGLDAVVYDAVSNETPFLGICVGMQMLYASSEESPGVPGLGVFPQRVVRIQGDVKLPQMQWNKVDDQWYYFVHSYAAEFSDDVIATCDYGGPVVAMIRRRNVWATQFHPEKSGEAGLALLQDFVKQAA